jgi:predicted RNA-binding Zn-ribbon protein involved in translation (DUF1610 family)
MASAAPGKSSTAATLFFCCLALAGFAVLCHVAGVTVCPLKRLTGFPCPTCGTTRACMAMLCGDVRGAFRIQPFAVSFCFGVLPVWGVAVLVVGGSRVRAFLRAVFSRCSVRLLFLALLIADWIYVIRNGN